MALELNRFPRATVRGVLRGLEEMEVQFSVRAPLGGDRIGIPVDAQLLELYLYERPQFWMAHFGIGQEQYEAWQRHLARAEDGMVRCLAPAAMGRPCRNRMPAQWDGGAYDSAVDDYCRSHREAGRDLPP